MSYYLTVVLDLHSGAVVFVGEGKGADAHLQDLIVRAEASGIKILKDFAKTIHSRGILAYYDHLISTGPLEGTNNKIKTL